MVDTSDPANLAAIFKAYDVRGLVPEQIDDDLARKTGNAFVQVTQAPTVVVGHDMRPSSPGMAGAFADGAAQAGADVVMIGLASTDQLYFASGHLGHAGAMFTASHNPAQYNGIKLCRTHAQPIGLDTGLAEIRDVVASGEFVTATRSGSIGLASWLGKLPSSSKYISISSTRAAPRRSKTAGAVSPAIPLPASTTTLSLRPRTGARLSTWAA